jgi:carbon monoxide dehydrogenase subunit G
MPEITHSFSVRAEAGSVQKLLTDLGRVYLLFPPFASAEKTPAGYRWHLKGALKLEVGMPFLEASIEEQQENSLLWRAYSPDLHWQGAFAWSAAGEDTHVTLRLEIKDVGLLGRMHETLIAVRITELAHHFEKKVREALEEKAAKDDLE